MHQANDKDTLDAVGPTTSLVQPAASSAFIEAWYDGACEPFNPGGHTSWGALIKQNSKIVWSGCGYIGFGNLMSNNVAEYAGVLAVLKQLLKMNLQRKRIIVYGDNNMSVQQMEGRWKARKGLYLESHKQALVLKRQFKDIRFRWISRDFNLEADELSKTPLAQRGIHERRARPAPRASALIGTVGVMGTPSEKTASLPSEERAMDLKQGGSPEVIKRGYNHSATT